ncbi:hypothetical protein BTM74_18525 [Salmonella enterica]|nr:hypothetical protein [Salmonella enterica]
MRGLSGQFSDIKIIPQVLHFSLRDHIRKSFFDNLIAHLNILYNQVIIEGVKNVNSSAFQGWFLLVFGLGDIPNELKI